MTNMTPDLRTVVTAALLPVLGKWKGDHGVDNIRLLLKYPNQINPVFSMLLLVTAILEIPNAEFKEELRQAYIRAVHPVAMSVRRDNPGYDAVALGRLEALHKQGNGTSGETQPGT